jgi:HEAT repeat protein
MIRAPSISAAVKIPRIWIAGAAAAALALLAAPAHALIASTNEMPSASFEELIFHAQRYGNTEAKATWKTAARDEVFRRGPDSLRWLVGHAKIDNIMIQVLAEELMYKLKAEQAVPVLLEALGSPEPRTRRTAVYFLSFFSTPEHAARLMPLLKDDETAGAAIRTLGKWKVKAAVPDILPFLTHEKEVRRIAAVNALRDIGDPAAVPALIERLGDPLFTVRETASRALVALGAPARKALIRALPRAEGQALRQIIRTLGELPAWRTSRALRPYLKHPDPAVRADAAVARAGHG